MELDEFTHGYIACALWLADENPGSGEWDKFDEFFARLDPQTLERIVSDCEKFQLENLTLLETAYRTDNFQNTVVQAGHDFYLTRNHHGSGFWDGDWEEFGEQLSAASKKFGEFNLYVDEDEIIFHL